MKIAINGFGRIGRITLRALLQKSGLQIIAINDLSDTKTLAHLFKYDSVHRGFHGEVSAEKAHLMINGHKIMVFAERIHQNFLGKISISILSLNLLASLLTRQAQVCICRQERGRLLFLLHHPIRKYQP